MILFVCLFIQKVSDSSSTEGEVTVAYMPSMDQIAGLSQHGNMDLTCMKKVGEASLVLNS